jgi:Ca-activated chloride channel family protein
MIEWAHPHLLWLLLLVPVLALLVWRRERRRRAALAAFAESDLLPRLAPDVAPRRRGVREGLRLVALALLVIALAGPRWGSRWEEVRREGVDLLIALDTSRSMLATDVKPNRIERARLAILDLVTKLRGDRVGLVAFAGAAFLECPLTLDYGAFAASLNATGVGTIPRGGTNLAAAIETSLDAFEARQGRYEALIVITDGESTEGEWEEAAEKSAELGVRIYTVGIGTAAGELIPAEGSGETWVKDREGQVVKSRLDETTLQEIALATRGAYVHGAGASLGLEAIFDDHIAKMERRELQTTLQRRFENRFQIPLAVALLLLLLEPMVGERRRAATAVLVLLTLAAPAGVSADQISEGNRLYHEGKYDEAAQQYGDALVDSPGSPLLRFNLAAAQYKLGRFEDAVKSLEQIEPSRDAAFDARVAYNLGNSLFRQGELRSSWNAREALPLYESALAAYRRAMGADPADTKAKFNHEVVERQIEALKKKIEEEEEKKRQEEEQKQEQEQEQEQQQDEQRQEQDEGQEEQQEQQEQEQQDGEPEEQDQSSEQGEEQPRPEQGEEPSEGQEESGEQQPEPGEESPAEPEPRPGSEESAQPEAAPEQSLDQQEAQGVLDTAREDEVRPDELRRFRGPAGIYEPAQDW